MVGEGFVRHLNFKIHDVSKACCVSVFRQRSIDPGGPLRSSCSEPLGTTATRNLLCCIQILKTWFTHAFRRYPHLFGWGGSRVAQIRGRKEKSSDSRWWREKKWESKNEKPRSFFPASILGVVMLSDLDTARLFMH